ncbi:heavy metal translocating P-type ATPase [Bacteriovorax sp. Seq25_V]|uniref:heavy metal translocating P-type ATPase n=1 Tax=Bacteriovorax sp. Seq25_V TaxID=1201288 RepID=UPI00038A13AD|nr:heavy metal translocating P-type ATPase [Bacteriovorax sp. Seq25_V]EQC43685.1 heavy metal translocating P-type ATPase [Bacteriovorax sp. Seq25_V]
MSTEPINTLKCKHCNDSFDAKVAIFKNEDVFCCNGCKTVYSILHTKGLDKFYELRNEEEDFVPSPISKDKGSFEYMNTEDFQAEFVRTAHDKKQVSFYLEGVHCMACIWLIEKTPNFILGLQNARLNIAESTAMFEFSKDLEISILAKELTSLGYYPHPIALGDTSKKFQKQEERSEILRIGVAGAAMGNIMIYAVSNYAGADGIYKDAFNWLCLILSLPVVFYSAMPFYKTSLQALKLKSISIDMPLSLAILAGFVFSTIGLFTGSEHNYFDSITTLVFLILLSRYFVKKATQQGLNNKGLNTFFTNNEVTKIEGSREVLTHSRFIRQGDLVKFKTDEKILFDGVLRSYAASIDNSVITGESRPLSINSGEEIFAGSVNLEEEIILEVTATDNQTRLGKIVSAITNSELANNNIISSADKISKYFVWAVTFLTLSTFAYQLKYFGLNPALERALAIVIISCPCALALATPLAYIRTLSILKSQGIFIKNENILERIESVKNIFLDKTGTLTEGKFEIISFKNLSKYNDSYIHEIVNTLEQVSTHPIANSLKKHFKRMRIGKLAGIKNILSITGAGVSVKEDNHNFYFGKLKDAEQLNSKNAQVGLYENDELIATYTIGDKIKSSTPELIQKLIKLGKIIHIASGDNNEVVASVATELGLERKLAHGNLSPEDKAHLISGYSDTLMVGDGINDVLAFKKSSVSIAVSGSADLSMRASDIFITNQNLRQIYNLIILAKETHKVVFRNFYFSLFYNIAGVLLALFGYITPLMAAVFMPVSSLTVLASSFLGTNNIRKIEKFKERQ